MKQNQGYTAYTLSLNSLWHQGAFTGKNVAATDAALMLIRTRGRLMGTTPADYERAALDALRPVMKRERP